MFSDEPEEETIEAWLSGRLTDAEAAEVEAFFDSQEELVEDETLLDIDFQKLAQLNGDEELARLITAIKKGDDSKSAKEIPSDAWKELLDPANDPELIGRLGIYEILDVVAIGGMGIVFRGWDPALNRIAAVKAIAPALASNSRACERFLREAQAGAKLEHENILPVYGVHQGKFPHFAMRFAVGGTLQERLSNDLPFDFDALRSLAFQIASALDTAHEQGIIHRDIKPANILFDEDEKHLWVCDFGIARSADDPSLTYAGTIAGTPQFMSPEQAAGKVIDSRSDLFSLGAVLYRCATGKHAFSGETSASVMQNIETANVAMILRDDVPLWFRRLTANLLARDVNDRPQTAKDVLVSIENEYSPRPKHPLHYKRRMQMALAFTCIAGLSFAAAQIPVVEARVNQVLASGHPQTFCIQGKIGAYSDLPAAINRAGTGDVITVSAGGVIEVDSVQIPEGKELTLLGISDESRRPLMTTAVQGAPGIISKSDLTLVGIDFELNPGEYAGAGIVIGKNAHFRFEKCDFTRKSDGKRGNWNAIELQGKSGVEISKCKFDLPGAEAIKIRDSGESVESVIVISEAEITAALIVELVNYSGTAKIEATSSSFNSNSFLKVSPSPKFPIVNCVTDSCVFSTLKSLCWIQTTTGNDWKERFRWTGTANEHPGNRAMIQIGDSDSVLEASRILPIDVASADFLDRSRGIENVETGEIFQDLRAAVSKAVDGTHFVLNGRFLCTGEIRPPREITLHFRAGINGATIVADHPDKHGMFVTGPSTFEGIDFERTRIGKNVLPILGLAPGENGDAFLRDCSFKCSQEGGIDGLNAGLSLTDFRKVEIERCRFFYPRGTGILLASVGTPTWAMNLNVTESVFVTRSAFHRRNRIDDSYQQITALSCVVFSDFLISDNNWNPFYRLDAAFHQSILDCNKGLFFLPSATKEIVQEELGWTSQLCFYRNDRPAVLTGTSIENSVSLIGSYQSLLKILPKSRSVQDSFAPVFDRSQLPATSEISEKILLDALPPHLETEARSALKPAPE